MKKAKKTLIVALVLSTLISNTVLASVEVKPVNTEEEITTVGLVDKESINNNEDKVDEGYEEIDQQLNPDIKEINYPEYEYEIKENEIEESNQPIDTTVKEEVLNDESASIVDEQGTLIGEVYEKTKINIPQNYSYVDEYGIVREEFIQDRKGLESLQQLIVKTESDYEIALAYSDGSFKYVNDTNSMEDAINFAKGTAIKSNDAPIPVVIDRNGQVIYATEALGRIIKYIGGNPDSTNNNITDIYTTSQMKTKFTYINHGYIDDVPIIEDLGNVAKVQIAGYNGWVNKDINSPQYDLVVVPLNQAKNPSHYIVKNGELLHYISSDLVIEGKGYYIAIGPAPSYLKDGVKYYSYDSKNFYTSLSTLINDLQNNTSRNSINNSDTYYSYYQNLPFRSKTKYTASELNEFIENNSKSDSKLIGNGQAFIDAQNKYGVNAILMLGVAINESAWGSSAIAKEKNNIFGINAVDSAPGQSANSFNTVADCINEFAKNYISRGYADPVDWRYFGGHLGDKGAGATVKYASDPFWGEKAARYAYSADYELSEKNLNELRDYNYYQLGVYTNYSEVKNNSGELLYNIKDINSSNCGKIGTTVIIEDEELLWDNKKWYKINPERTTAVNDGGSTNKFQGEYSWSDYGYTPVENIRFINTQKPAGQWIMENNKWYYYEGDNLVTGWKKINRLWYYLGADGAMKTGWINLDNTWYYLNDSGVMQTGWLQKGDDWYYLNQSGVMQIGWAKVSDKWYYMNQLGVMQKGWLEHGSHWYYLNQTGEMKIGWLSLNGTWYYLNKDGIMQTGWLLIDNNWYYLNELGVMQQEWIILNNKWYYLNSSGVMQTGWINLNNTWYYLYQSGEMAVSTVIDGWKINSNGVATPK